MDNLLAVDDLSVAFHTPAGVLQAVKDVSFTLQKGEALGIVGESGCGKSVTAHAIMRLIGASPGCCLTGHIMFRNTDLLTISEHDMNHIRGKDISIIFQDPMTALNPVLTIGCQLAEPLQAHLGLSSQAAYCRAAELLQLVNIPSPQDRLSCYPHQFSGGMRQRVMIAMALACNPALLIADEPTTALDVTVQAQILGLLQKLQADRDMSIIFISHDMGAIAGLCQQVLVMYAGRIVEAGSATTIFHEPHHPYTQSLLKSIPRLDASRKTKLAAIDGQPPNMLEPPDGCPFFPRCRQAMNVCATATPPAYQLADRHTVYCWREHPLAQAQHGGACHA